MRKPTSSKSKRENQKLAGADVKEEYERLGIRFSFGVPDADTTFRDYRFEAYLINLENFRKFKDEEETRLAEKSKLTKVEKDHLKALVKREKGLRDMLENPDDIYKYQDYTTAKNALTYYNAQHDVEFELVECLGAPTAFIRGRVTHTNFWAKKSGDSEKKLFFAELLGSSPDPGDQDDRQVNWCEILDESTFVRGCCMCSKGLAHPERFKPLSWLDKDEDKDEGEDA